MFAAMKARGLQPVVTLNHYALPVWIHDAPTCHVDFANCERRGWVDDERTIREIAKFSGFVAGEFWWRRGSLGDQRTATKHALRLLSAQRRAQPSTRIVLSPRTSADGLQCTDHRPRTHGGRGARPTMLLMQTAMDTPLESVSSIRSSPLVPSTPVIPPTNGR